MPIQYFLQAQKKALDMLTPQRVRDLLAQISETMKDMQELEMDFDPSELRGPMKDLLFGLIKGRKIHDFISLAWKRKINVMNDPILSNIIGCLQASYY